MSAAKKQFGKIYDKYIDRIYRFIFFRVSSQPVAEDLTSETFTRGWEVFKKNQKEIENIQAFLYQIARNLVIDHYREKGKAQLVSVDFYPIADSKAGPEKEFQLESDLDKVKEALVDLNEDYQTLIIWHYLEDISISEIAKMLKKSKGAIRVQLHRALKALKENL